MTENIKELMHKKISDSMLFAGLSEQDLAQVLKDVQIKKLKKGEFFYHQGDMPTGVYMMVEGKMVFNLSDLEGRELVLAYCQPDQWHGYPEIMSGQKAEANAIVLEDASFYLIPGKKFIQFTKDYEPLSQVLIKYLSFLHLMLTKVIAQTSHKGLDYRVARQIAMMSFYSGYHKGQVEVWSIQVTQEELANCVAASRQSVSKILKKWEKEERISIKFGEIEILEMSWLLEQV